MKYIAEQEIIKSWSRLIDSNETNHSLNKFFGLIEIIRNLNLVSSENIKAGFQYHLNTGDLSNALQSKYFFGSEPKDFRSTETLFVIFPENWNENISTTFLKGKTIGLFDTAILCLQNNQFEDSFSPNDLKSQFLEKYHLSNVSAKFFHDEKMDVKFQNT